jgi:hypothetical protein
LLNQPKNTNLKILIHQNKLIDQGLIGEPGELTEFLKDSQKRVIADQFEAA